MRANPRRDPVTGLLPEQVEFLDWMLDPNPEKGSQNDWCRARDIATSLPPTWKREDAAFQIALRQRTAESALGAEVTHKIIQAMAKKAAEGDVQAARVVFDYQKFLDPTPPTQRETPIESMDDTELATELEREAARLRANSADS